jgi:hypothetical protein
MGGMVVAAAASLLIVVASLIGAWIAIQTSSSLFEGLVLSGLSLCQTFGVVATWMWAFRWRSLKRSGAWSFILGRRPNDAPALAAWTWGRLSIVAWLVVIISLAALSIYHS